MNNVWLVTASASRLGHHNAGEFTENERPLPDAVPLDPQYFEAVRLCC